jgi:hypothetical protein
MRFSLPSASFLSLLLTAKSLACVQFRAQIDFEYVNEAFVSAQLVDEGGLTCWSTQQAVDQTQYSFSFVWPDCIDESRRRFRGLIRIRWIMHIRALVANLLRTLRGGGEGIRMVPLMGCFGISLPMCGGVHFRWMKGGNCVRRYSTCFLRKRLYVAV